MRVRIGQMRHRIDVERRTPAASGYGEAVGEWQSLLRNYPARVKDESSAEQADEMKPRSEKVIRIEMHHPRVQITAADRVVWSGSANPTFSETGVPTGDTIVLDIQQVLAGENDGRYLTLICSEHID